MPENAPATSAWVFRRIVDSTNNNADVSHLPRAPNYLAEYRLSIPPNYILRVPLPPTLAHRRGRDKIRFGLRRIRWGVADIIGGTKDELSALPYLAPTARAAVRLTRRAAAVPYHAYRSGIVKARTTMKFARRAAANPSLTFRSAVMKIKRIVPMIRKNKLLCIYGIVGVGIVTSVYINFVLQPKQSIPALASLNNTVQPFLYNDPYQALGLPPAIPGLGYGKKTIEKQWSRYSLEFSPDKLAHRHPDWKNMKWFDQVYPFGFELKYALEKAMKQPYCDSDKVNVTKIRQEHGPDLPHLRDDCRCGFSVAAKTLIHDILTPFWRAAAPSPQTLEELKTWCPRCTFQQANENERFQVNTKNVPPPLDRYIDNEEFVESSAWNWRYWWLRFRMKWNRIVVNDLDDNEIRDLILTGWAGYDDFLLDKYKGGCRGSSLHAAFGHLVKDPDDYEL